MRTRRRLTTTLAAGAIALGGLAGCGGDDETTSVPESDPAGSTGATGAGAEQDAEKPASEAQEEGSGSGLEQDISGADADGTDTEAGQQGTVGDPTAE